MGDATGCQSPETKSHSSIYYEVSDTFDAKEPIYKPHVQNAFRFGEITIFPK